MKNGLLKRVAVLSLAGALIVSPLSVSAEESADNTAASTSEVMQQESDAADPSAEMITVDMTIEYVDTAGEMAYQDIGSMELEKGSTYQDAIDKAKTVIAEPADMTTEYRFLGEWRLPYMGGDLNTTIEKSISMTFSAVYEEKLVQRHTSYYGEDGFRKTEREIINAGAGATYDSVKKLLDEVDKSGSLYDGLKFAGWHYYIMPMYETGELPGGVTNVSQTAGYSNCLVRFIINPDDPYWMDTGNVDQGAEYIQCQVVNDGTTISIPKNFEGYESVTWKETPHDYMEGSDSYTVARVSDASVADFIGTGVKEATPVPETVDVSYLFEYVDTEGNYVSTEEKSVSIEKGSTYQDAIDKVLEDGQIPADMTSEYEFLDWELPYLDGYTEMIPEEGAQTLLFRAIYDQKLVVMGSAYYNIEGYYLMENEVLAVDDNTTYEDVRTETEAKDDQLAMYEGLRLDEWDYYVNEQLWDDVLPEGITPISRFASYENCMVRFIITDNPAWDAVQTDQPGGADYMECRVIEVGETVDVPEAMGSYTDIKWSSTAYGYEEGSSVYTAVEKKEWMDYAGVYDFVGMGVKQTEEPETPETPDNELPQEVIDSVVDTIENTPAGGRVSVDMGAATVVPEEALRAAKGKDVDIVLEMAGYTWTINGKDITGEDLQDIDLEVKADVNAIPKSAVDRLADGKSSKQISIAHDGEFGFTAELKIYVGNEYAEQYGNLFWYDNGKFSYITSGLVDETGYVTLKFSHASDYVIVMSKSRMSEKDIPADLKAETSDKKDKAPQTGDITDIMPYLMLLAGASLVIAAVCRKRR